MNPKVSFVTVNFRMTGLIRQLLKGVQAAKFSFPYEYFLIDNSPGDGTGAMVREEFPSVAIIDHQGNVGFGAGNNLALRKARGEYIMLANPDLTIFPGQMEKLLEFADAHPDIGLIGPKVLNPDRSLQRSCYRFPSPLIPLYRRTFLGSTPWGERAVKHYFMEDTDLTRPQDVDGLFGAALLIRRRALDDIGLFDERFFMYLEDTDLCRRSWEAGWRVVYAPVAEFVHYHQRESRVKHVWQAFTNRVARIHIDSAIKYFWKYRGKPNPREGS